MVVQGGLCHAIGDSTMHRMLLTVMFTVGCAAHAHVDDAGSIAKSDACDRTPNARTTGFRHLDHWALAKVGESRHRGIDLIALETDEMQHLGGKLAYTVFDKDLEDEDAEVFACIEGGWRSLGLVRTDDDGRFALTLAGDARLPVGMRDLYAFVRGDGSGVRFLAYVAPDGASLLASDVDGTLTSSESAFFDTVLTGDDVGHQARAPEALANRGHVVVYLTARGDQFTNVTRWWLRQHGFPVGPLRLAPVTLPGSDTVDYKTETLVDLRVPVAAGIGNRATDIAAYTNVGLGPDQILIFDREFGNEVRGQISAHSATGFGHYDQLPSLLPAR